MTHILAIDQGTTSSRAILFDSQMAIVAVAQEEFTQHFPKSGWVEHDPDDIWSTVRRTSQRVMKKAGVLPSDVAGIGITNQRETTLLWDRKTGEPVYNAIVWQDRRTADLCKKLKEEGHEPLVTSITGLFLDPYFSATKLAWILDHVEGVRARAQAGDLLFGTVDSYLIWKMTDAKVHATDATNAARTMLYDIHQGTWSSQLCELLNIPMEVLPTVCDCAADFGITSLLGEQTPILGVAGDQQAATIGQACFKPGMIKSTYGTGCFVLLNTGDQPVQSKNRLLTTVAYQLDGKPTYALEGSIFVAGAVVQWLRDGLKIINSAPQTQSLAEAADPEQELILVPAFTGLGAPYWQPNCRGAIYGLTRGSGQEEIVRAALESIGFQTRDLFEAMKADWSGGEGHTLRVDGGMSASNYTIQFVSDLLNVSVDRPPVLETTALGVAWLAGNRAGIYPDQEAFAKNWRVEKTFEPKMSQKLCEDRYVQWKKAVKATIQMGAVL